MRPGDNFNEPDETNLGPNWNEYLPDLEIFNGQVRNKDTGSKAAIFTWPIGPDQDVSVNCKVTAANNACGVMARWSDAGNYYYVRLDVGQLNLVLFKSVKGVVTEIGRTNQLDTRYDTYYLVRLVAHGTSLFASVTVMRQDEFSNNFPITYQITANDTSLSAGDYSGIRSFASAPDTTWFENFSVTQPDAPVPGGLLFTDEFNRTGGLGQNWRVTAGSYTTDGTFAVSGGAANWAAITKALGTNDYTVESVLIIPTGSLYSGIVARGNPSAFSSDLYAAQLSTNGTVNLYRRNVRSFSVIRTEAQPAFSPGFPGLRTIIAGSSMIGLRFF